MYICIANISKTRLNKIQSSVQVFVFSNHDSDILNLIFCFLIRILFHRSQFSSVERREEQNKREIAGVDFVKMRS